MSDGYEGQATMESSRPDEGLPGAANDVALSPVSFLHRAADVSGDDIGVRTETGEAVSWARLRTRAEQLSGALRGLGLEAGDRVAVLAPNGLPLLEAHYGVPGAGCALVALNTRLAPQEYELLLRLAEAKVLLVDPSLADKVADAAPRLPALRAVLTLGPGDGAYEDCLRAADPATLRLPADERQPLAVNFTSGTTGGPKGVVYTHRGSYLNALGQVHSTGLRSDSRYLWTLPMFHCNGWCHTWAVTAAGAEHLVLPKVEPERVLDLMEHHRVTHLCGAPAVLDSLVEHGGRRRGRFPQRALFAVGGAAPSPTAIEAMTALGVDIMHLYGMTETYGPSLVCEPRPEWRGFDAPRRASVLARQGVRTVNVESARVVTESFEDVPADGRTTGELIIRSNTVMSHYLDDEEATRAALRGGWLHTGDVAVRHPDGYLEIRDRLKDVIISGGENLSSIEVENALRRHPAVAEAAVVAQPHARWGEVPVAFVRLRDGGEATGEELTDWLRERMAHFKVPRQIHFSDLPKTSTGKVRKAELRNRLQ
ncbi:AMP-binding protein [Streptomyces sulphureus]|uniref:AMP-binding protein n=1 Tax=Streptomyces sulphureus TaxID=47758 RepID=UPI0003A3DF34|nr:AMP-binding protein [Streptomyces sulphureus]